MKHDELRSIAHNLADSFASGVGIPIGIYTTNVFAEAKRSPENSITIDFLNGAVVAGRVIVTIEDNEGRRSIDEYLGGPLRHLKRVDGAGRVRTLRKPRRV